VRALWVVVGWFSVRRLRRAPQAFGRFGLRQGRQLSHWWRGAVKCEGRWIAKARRLDWSYLQSNCDVSEGRARRMKSGVCNKRQRNG